MLSLHFGILGSWEAADGGASFRTVYVWGPARPWPKDSLELGHGLVSGDGFQSADNTPASSDRLQQLGGGETDQGEEGSTTAESEASGPPSPQSPLLEKVAPGRPRDWLSPTS